MIFAPTNRRIIRPYDKPPFEHTQRYGLIKDHPLGQAGGLVFFPIMNEGSGKIVSDLSGNNLTGSLFNQAHFVAGKYGSAVNLDGVGDYIVVPHNSAFDFGTGDFSGIIYARNTYGAYLGLLSHHYNPGWSFYWMGSNANDNLRLAIEATYKNSGVSVEFDDGLWHQLGFSKEGDNVYFYYDGLPVGSNSGLLGKNASSTDTLKMGTLTWSGQELFGDISHAGIWNRALNASEHAELTWNPFCMVQKKAAPVYFFVPTEVGEPPTGIPIFRRRRTG